MDNIIYFENLFKCISDYRKSVLLIFLVENDKNFVTECGFLKDDGNRLCLEFNRTK